MAQPINLRVPRRWWPASAALCILALAPSTRSIAQTPQPQTQPEPQTQSQAQLTEGTQGKPQVRAAQDAYLAGAKRLQHNDLPGAERNFAHALQLDPGNTDYSLALSLTRQHRLTELVQQSSQARQAGDAKRADTLLAEAREIDPTNPILLEHSSSAALQNSTVPQPPPYRGPDVTITPLTDRVQLLTAGDAREPWKLPTPVLAGPIELKTTKGTKDFHLRGSSQDVLRSVAQAFGIRAVFDESVARKDIHFDLEKVDYKQAMAVLMSMAQVFAVPIDETSVLIAKDDNANRLRLERLMEETIYLSGFTPEQIADVANVMRNVFQLKPTVQPDLGNIIVRAPEDVMKSMNQIIADLIDGSGEVMVDVKVYEIETTRMRNIGATLPTQVGFYNVNAAALSLVSQNQALVQQAIAQGFVPANASNIEIALALIASGLVQSSVLSNTVGFFGGGITKTGVTSTTQVTFNLGLNSSDNRALDDVQMQVGDRQPATFRSGSRYPIVTSTYATGLASPTSALGSATINGVSVASLLQQFSGGSGGVTPQVSYEDLGITLKATPIMQKSGRINLNLDMKIEALAGGTLNGNPILANRQFTSDITVGDGESAMMVSELDRTESIAVAGIPGLSELPGFQAPVSQNAEKDTGQLVVLVTPHVIRRRSDMVAGPRILVRALEASAN